MNFLHTMLRIKDIDAALHFFCDGLGLQEVRRMEMEEGRFTLIFLAASGDLSTAQSSLSPTIELTYNWDTRDYHTGDNFGHLAFSVDHIYDTCVHLESLGIEILRPPRDGFMAFVKSPDGVSVELLQKGDRLTPEEPWASRENVGSW